MNGRLGLLGGALVIGGALLIGAGSIVGGEGTGGYRAGGGMMGGYGGGMMGGYGGYGAGGSVAPGPGETGFVAGTADAPRVVRVLATPDLRFVPAAIRVQAGETIRFDVTTMGPTAHEFMVGPAGDVEADRAGTPEIEGLSMMETGSVTYTFSGPGPFAFACHVPGHHEAGMRGTIDIVS